MSEASVVDKAITGIITAGPVASVLLGFLWIVIKQNRELTKKNDKLTNKMVKLAVRTLRAVEVLANLDVPEIEADIDDDDDDDDDEDSPRKKRKKRGGGL